MNIVYRYILFPDVFYVHVERSSIIINVSFYDDLAPTANTKKNSGQPGARKRRLSFFFIAPFPIPFPIHNL